MSTVKVNRSHQSIPVTKAFCSWPLNPVFQGTIVLTVLLLEMINMITRRMRRKITAETAIISIREWPESPEGRDVSGGLSSWRKGGEGIGGVDTFGAAGNDPLLLLGRVTAGSNGGRTAVLGGRATRLLDCSTSMRRALFTSSFVFWTMCCSGGSRKCKSQIKLDMKLIFFCKLTYKFDKFLLTS